MNRELKRYKKKLEYSYTYGVYPTLDLLQKRPELVELVLLSPNGNNNDGVVEIVNIAKSRNIPIVTNQRLILKLSAKENTLAVGKFKKYESDLSGDTNHVVLVNPADAGNLGTIMRSMAGFGFNDLAIVAPGVDSFDPRVVRSSMGARFNINVKYFDTFDDYLADFNTHKVYTFALNTDETLENTNFESPFTLVFGNEGAGLPDEIVSKGNAIRITQSDQVESLNLGVSVSIALNQCKNLNKVSLS